MDEMSEAGTSHHKFSNLQDKASVPRLLCFRETIAAGLFDKLPQLANDSGRVMVAFLTEVYT